MISKYKGLPYIQTRDAVGSAIARIEGERSGLQQGLVCRYDALNRAVTKYFRFGKVVMIAGMSGSGKSYFLNMLRNDFTNTKDIEYDNTSVFNLNGNTIELVQDEKTGIYREPKIDSELRNMRKGIYYQNANLLLQDNNKLLHRGINKDCVHNVILIHFGYEMDPEDELIRNAGTIVGKGYGFLMSSEWDKEIKDYRRLSDKDFDDIKEVFNHLKQRKEYYVPSSGNTDQMKATVAAIIAKYPEDVKFVITIDHTLLSKRLKERSDSDLQQSVAMVAVFFKQVYGALVILLNQMNQKIEEDDRLLKPALHYPSKKDIHLGGQIFWACDTVMINHRPKILDIALYGKEKLITDNLIHCSIIKNRQGTLGDIWLKEDFANGRIYAAKKEDFMLK